jgi:hypothetical protein
MAEVYLPNLHWFAMKNLFTGSCGNLRFRAKPNVEMATAKEVDFGASSITVELWHGPFCYEKSEMEAQREFPMSNDGLSAMKQWLEENV